MQTGVRIIFPGSRELLQPKNLILNAFLVPDNALRHPTSLNSLSENVKVVILPLNTVFATATGAAHNLNFQGLLFMKNFVQAVQATTREGEISLTQYWKN